jgi:hypothetical protein
MKAKGMTEEEMAEWRDALESITEQSGSASEQSTQSRT